MFAIQTAIKYTEKNIGRYLFLGVIVFVIAVTSVIAYRIANPRLSNVTVIDRIELMCDININSDNEISIYKLTVVGYLCTEKGLAENIPPVVSQSFDLITDGNIKSIESIVLSAYINGNAIKYDIAYAVLEEVDIGRNSK